MRCAYSAARDTRDSSDRRSVVGKEGDFRNQDMWFWRCILGIFRDSGDFLVSGVVFQKQRGRTAMRPRQEKNQGSKKGEAGAMEGGGRGKF